ncbi:aldolase/citrate lyase family protein [Candidatus Latescibacterota bacterium]
MTVGDLKTRIRQGEQVVGFGLPATARREQFAAALDQGPYEFVFVDSQHSPLSQPGLVSFCQLASEFSLPVRFRLEHTRLAYLSGIYLDLGASGIEVPQVETEATAREAVEAFYYPPVGRRSLGGGARIRVADFDTAEAYAAWWNGYGVLWLQVESLSSVVKAPRLALPGVDCLAFGPADLALDIANHPNPPYATVDDCVRAVARSLEGSDTVVSFRSGAPELRQKYADLGVTVFLERPPVPV